MTAAHMGILHSFGTGWKREKNGIIVTQTNHRPKDSEVVSVHTGSSISFSPEEAKSNHNLDLSFLHHHYTSTSI